MNPQQISRQQFRVGLFQRRGLSYAEAQQWAVRLTARDAARDDRRICLECSQLQQTGACRAIAAGHIKSAAKNHHPVRTLLQRCEGFTFLKP